MNSLDRLPKWGVPVFLAGLTIFFYWKIIFTNRVMFPWDAADFFYPYLSFVHEELRHFRLPLWDPYVMSGFPIIGDLEAQIFYPLNWLFVLLHPFSELPYKLVEGQIILHFFLAGLFMYCLARSFVQSKAAALFGAVLFMLSGAMVAHTEHLASIESMAWYPLIFLLARRGLLERNYFLTASAGMIFGIQILVGHWQHSVYLGFFLFLYFAYEACFGPMRAQLWPHWIVSLALIGGIGAAFGMVQIIPTHELGNLSVRSYLTYWEVTAGNEPRYLWTLFLPNYFGGLNGFPTWYPYDFAFNYVFLTVPGFLLAFLGLAETIRRRNFFWLGMVLLCMELSFGRNGYLSSAVYHTPILNLFRNVATFFDLANFCFCLMAALGAESLFSKTLAQPVRRYLPACLGSLLLAATALGMILQFHLTILGWYHMLAVLAVFSVVVTAMLQGKLSVPASQWAILGLMVFQLYFYNMNQFFNWTVGDPRRYMSHEFAVSQKGTLQFLRSDPAADFRVAAIAEYPWSGNGWNVWRIPGIFGWNPITLRRYDEYIRQFIHTSEYTLPYGGPDHNLDSPMFDLLGTKYLVAADPVLEKKNILLRPSDKFELVFEDLKWWRTYRNKNYLSRAWFYPRAYLLPGEEQAYALMSSNWFDARHTLLFEKGDLPQERGKLAEELAVTTLEPKDVKAASSGYVMAEPYCAKPVPIHAAWGEKKGDWLRFDVTGQAQPARYLLLIRYTAASQPTPTLDVEVQNGGGKQHSAPVTLPGTIYWDCHKSRTAELGTIELAPGKNQLTITSREKTDIHLFSLYLVRLPASPPPEPSAFSFGGFSVSANRISFRSNLSREGFVLLNEIYYPGWEASIDGGQAQIIRADGIFRALFVPAGEHRLEFRFWPRHFALGAATSVLTLFGYLAYGAAWRRKNPGQGLASLFQEPGANKNHAEDPRHVDPALS